jgi:hypothetical protein
MKKFTTLRWVACMLVALAGGLASCDQTSNTSNGSVTTTEEADIEDPKPDPKPGKPGRLGTEVNLGNSIQYVKNYRKRAASTDLRSAYFDTALLDSMLRECNCAGLRFYLADSTKDPKDRQTHMIVVRVDSAGKDIDLGQKTLSPQYKLGISDEKCPDNCGGSFVD